MAAERIGRRPYDLATAPLEMEATIGGDVERLVADGQYSDDQNHR
jgi:hypothetical protein